MRYIGLAAIAGLMLFVLLSTVGCSANSGQALTTLVVTPPTAFLHPGDSQEFTTNMPVYWRVVEEEGGKVTPAGVYTAPYYVSTYHIVATCITDASITRTVAITVTRDEP